jgi:hypothetical protein
VIFLRRSQTYPSMLEPCEPEQANGYWRPVDTKFVDKTARCGARGATLPDARRFYFWQRRLWQITGRCQGWVFVWP